MAIPDYHIRMLVNGLADIDLSGLDSIAEYKISGSKTKLILGLILANQMIDERNLFDSLKKTLDQTTEEIGKENPYAPLHFCLLPFDPTHRDLMGEILHLCKKVDFFIHPMAVPALLRKKWPFHHLATLYSLLSPQSREQMAEDETMREFALDQAFSSFKKNAKPALLKSWMHYRLITQKEEKIHNEFNAIWDASSTQQRLLLTEVIRSSYFTSVPLHLKDGLLYSSKKLNRAIYRLLLFDSTSMEAKEIGKVLCEFLLQGEIAENTLFSSLGDQLNMTETELFYFIAETLSPEKWIEKVDLKKLLTTSPASQNHQYLSALLTASLIHQKPQYSIPLLQKLIQDGAHQQINKALGHENIFLDAKTFFQVAMTLTEMGKAENYIILDRLASKYSGFWPDKLTVQLLKKLKDPEFPLLFSETGTSVSISLCQSIAIRGNPTLQNKLPNTSDFDFFHPLKDSFETIAKKWLLRRQIRLAFSKRASEL